jgi:hypothetical protein
MFADDCLFFPDLQTNKSLIRGSKTNSLGWRVYCGPSCIGKQRYDHVHTHVLKACAINPQSVNNMMTLPDDSDEEDEGDAEE